MYNPHVWAVPPPILQPPAVSLLSNQAQASLNGYGNIHQTISGENISAPSYSNYEVGNQIPHSPTKNMVHSYKNNFRGFDQYRRNASNYKFKNRYYLRTRISVNKRFQLNKCSPFTSRAHNFGNRQQQNNKKINRTFVPDRTFKQFVEETSSRLDLTPLKNYAAANVEDNWYIVIDMDVILNEFKFLNTLSDSDSQCHLVVPRHVMSELEHHVATSQDVQARRIKRFLSHQIEQGDVMIAEGPPDDYDDTPEFLLSTCLQMSKEHFHLVLLTNDSELNNYKDSIPIPIFTPIDVKRLLNVNLTKNQCISTPTFIPNQPFKNVSISFESDNRVSHNITFTKSPYSPSPPKVEKEYGANANEKTAIGRKNSKKMGAAFQTDFSEGIKEITINRSTLKQPLFAIYGVDSPSMEEYLVKRSDELVSKLKNIMIKALTVVLQHYPPFSNDSLPPPWNISEALKCIKMKFNNNKPINDAAFKFSYILLNLDGRRDLKIKPAEYMEMFSFGVYLLDTITAAVDNCEDLQIGVESLKNLLHDIRNPNMDNLAQEFVVKSLDHGPVQISSGNTSQPCLEPHEKVLSAEDKNKKKSLPNKPTNKKAHNYNLRFSKKEGRRSKRLFQDDEISSNCVRRTLNPESSCIKIYYVNLEAIKKTISNDKQIRKTDYQTEPRVNEFKYVEGMFILEVEEAVYAVNKICENYVEQWRRPEIPKMKKIELRVKIKNASAPIYDVWKVLDRILEREANNDANDDWEALHRKAGCQDFYYNEELRAEYRNTIAKCKKYAEASYNSIQDLLGSISC